VLAQRVVARSSYVPGQIRRAKNLITYLTGVSIGGPWRRDKPEGENIDSERLP